MMNRRSLCFVVPMVLMLAGLPMPSGWAADAQPALQSLDERIATLPHSDAAGQVVDEGGNPVPDADVFLYYEAGMYGFRDRLAGKVKTDAGGKFLFKDAVVWEPPLGNSNRTSGRFATVSGGIRSNPNPKYDVIARHPDRGLGFAVFMQKDPASQLKVTLDQEQKSDLSVTDAEGNPVEGASVHLSSLAHKVKRFGPQAEYDTIKLRLNIGLSAGKTGPDGKISLAGLPGSSFTAIKENYTKATASSVLTLFPAAPVRGRVLDDTKKSVAGALVWMRYRGRATSYLDYAVSGKDGRYAFPYAPGAGFSLSAAGTQREAGTTGNVTLSVQDTRIGATDAQEVAFTVQPGEKVERDLTLKRGLVLAGQVINAATGQPVPHIKLYRSEPYRAPDGSEGGYMLIQLDTDDQGRFSVSYAAGSQVNIYWNPAGSDEYLLDTDSRGISVAYSTVLNADKTDVVLKARLRPAKPLQGIVLGVDNKPAPRASVYIDVNKPPATSGKDGRFTIMAPLDRDYDVFTIGPAKVAAAVVHCKAGTTSVTLPTRLLQTYAGRVTTPDGLPADGLYFSLYPKLNGTILGDQVKSTTTTIDGEFILQGLCPQLTYYATWSGGNDQNRDYDNGTTTVDLSRLQPGAAMKFQARKFVNALMGKVVDSQGRPVPGAQISLEGSVLTPQDVRNSIRYTDKQGNFTIDRLAAGKILIKASHPQYKSRTLETATDNVDCAINLAPRGEWSTARLTVLDEEGNPVPDAEIKVLSRSGEAASLGMMELLAGQPATATSDSLKLTTDARGVAEFRAPASKLRPAGVVFVCDQPGYDLAYGMLAPEEDTELTLRLVKSTAPRGAQVVDENQQPVAGARVRLVSLGFASSMTRSVPLSLIGKKKYGEQSVATGPDGRFEFSRLGPQYNLSVAVTAPGFAPLNATLTTENPQDRLSIYQPGSLRVRVVAADTGKPVRNGSISLYSNERGFVQELTPDKGNVGADGVFTRNDLQSGSYMVQYRAGSFLGIGSGGAYAPAEDLTATVEAHKTTSLTLTLERTITVKGKLIDTATGQAPTEPYQVYAMRPSARMVDNIQIVRGNGAWEFRLAPGSYRFVWYARPDSGGGQVISSSKMIIIEKGKTYDNVVLEVKSGTTPARR